MRCRVCGEELPASEFRKLRLQHSGVCIACEYLKGRMLDAHQRELRARERREKAYRDYAGAEKLRPGEMRIVP